MQHSEHGTMQDTSAFLKQQNVHAQHVGGKALTMSSPFLLVFSDERTGTRYGELLPERKQVFLF